MKIVITKVGPYYRIYLQNSLFTRLLIDDAAHMRITLRSEAETRADALRVTLAAEVLDETGEQQKEAA